MSVVRWLHISDLHLNSQGMETERLRQNLPGYLSSNVGSCDYVFCTGDLRRAPEPFAANTVAYLKKLCSAVHAPTERLFIVPGNHDVNRSLPGREEALGAEYDSYLSRDGILGEPTLTAAHEGLVGFREVLAEVYQDVPGRINYYMNPKNPHFVIETEHFNILHVDTTIGYGEAHQRDLILGSLPLMQALKSISRVKPTILLTHYAITSLSQDERREVAELLRDYRVTLWLAGHEHEHNLMPYQYLASVQAGELQVEDQTNATVLVGEYDTDTHHGFIEAYTWFREGWAPYPIVWRDYGNESGTPNRFPFSLQPLEGALCSIEATRCAQANRQRLKGSTDIIAGILPGISYNGQRYTGPQALSQLLDATWNSPQSNVLITGDGGMGKTTLLLYNAWQRDSEAILYLSVEHLQAQGLGIEQQVCRVLFGTESARDKLYQLINTKKTRPGLILFLDGFNELTEKEAQYIRELKGLSAYQGLQLMVTSRENFTRRHSILFATATLEELSEEQVRGVLSQQEWAHIRDKVTLNRLLRNPMLLLMYQQICPIMERHRESFLDWYDTIENSTQLLHNYFTAQMAVLLDREGIDGITLQKAWLCCWCVLPYIGFKMEQEGQLSLSRESFDRLLDEVTTQSLTSVVSRQLQQIQRAYRERELPKLSPFDMEDYLVTESHLLHEDSGRLFFSHQIYRDYMSAQWMVSQSADLKLPGDADKLESIWNRRQVPNFVMGHVRNMSGRYWEGLAKKLVESAQNRDGSDVQHLLKNLVYGFSYTAESGTPDFSDLDLRGIRLPDYQNLCGRVPMKGTKIGMNSLALRKNRMSVFRRLAFSPNGQWLAGVSGGLLKVWFLHTSLPVMTCSLEQSDMIPYFTADNQLLLLFGFTYNQRTVSVFAKGQDWQCRCLIKDDLPDKKMRWSISSDALHICARNRVRRYRLTDGKRFYNQREEGAWKKTPVGESLPGPDELRKISAKLKGNPDGILYKTETRDGEFKAYSYVDGTLAVFQGNEHYGTLQQGSPILQAAAISANGKRAATLSQRSSHGKRKIQFWDLEKKKRCGERLCSDKTRSIDLSDSGKWIVGREDEFYWVQNWDDDEQQYILPGTILSNQQGKLTFYGDQLIYQNNKNGLELFDLKTRTTTQLSSYGKRGQLATLTPDGNPILVEKGQSKVTFQSIRGNWRLEINREPASITGIFFMKNQPFMGLVTSNQVLSIYHAGTGQRLRILHLPNTNNLFVCHPSKNTIACGGGHICRIFNLYSWEHKGEERSRWYENDVDCKTQGQVLDLAFNETNKELVIIFSDGIISFHHELYGGYHGATQIITHFNVDAYNFIGVCCDPETESILKDNGVEM